MNIADFDRQEKQVRNLRATLAVVIAKLRLNKTQGTTDQSHFVNREGLVNYIKNLVVRAMEGNDNIEIPEFFYDRSSLNNYAALKLALSTALTNLQRLAYDKHLTLDGIYRELMGSLQDLER